MIGHYFYNSYFFQLKVGGFAMGVLILTNEFPPDVYGGAGVHVEYLTRELAKLTEVDVRSFGTQDDIFENMKVKGYPYDEKNLKECQMAFKGVLQAFSRSINWCAGDEITADVVHCHTWYSHFGGILAKILYQIPLVVTTHSLEPLRPWKREQLGTGYDLSSYVERTAIEMADAVIAVSEETKIDVLNNFNVDPAKVPVIPNGIDTNQYHKVTTTGYLEKFGIKQDVPFVLFVGRITRQKGIVHLVNAIKYLDPGMQIVLCAGAPDTPEIAKEMEDGVNEARKTRDDIIWIDEMVTKEAAIEFYSHASVFCCPSIYEPFGIINLEAMACETPVVASAVGGIKEVVVEGETGFLVPFEQYDVAPFEAKDPDKFARELAAPINKLMSDAALRDKMGKAGRDRAINKYSWTAIAKDVNDLYNELIARNKKGK
jgi:glycogen synthase